MSIIISASIQKKEFGKKISADDIKVLNRTAKVELLQAIKGENLPLNASIFKAYATSKSGAKRIVYLMTTSENDFMLLFYRDKNDSIGKNITIKNPAFKKELNKHIDLLFSDLKEGKYIVI